MNYLRATGLKIGLLINFCHYPGVEHEFRGARFFVAQSYTLSVSPGIVPFGDDFCADATTTFPLYLSLQFPKETRRGAAGQASICRSLLKTVPQFG